MKPPGHAVVSLGIGAIVWGVTKSPYSVLAAFLTGVLIDLDHLVEYYSWFVREERSEVWFFLHSYELAVPAFLAGYMSGWDPVVLGVSAGFLGHVLTDQVVNPMRPLAYFFTYRAIKGFRRSEIIRADWGTIRKDFLNIGLTRTVLSRLNPSLRVEQQDGSQGEDWEKGS